MAIVEQTAAFLLTDIVGSTRLHELYPTDMVGALRQHADIIEGAVESEGGELFKRRGEGDSTFSVFMNVSAAVRASMAIQRGLASIDVVEGEPLRTRIGIHFGEALLFDGDYQGATVNLCARIRSLAHGGQILVSNTVRQIASGFQLLDLGIVRLADVYEPQRIFQVCGDGLAESFPPLRTMESSQLPKPATPFVGRQAEAAELEDLVREHHLVTISGLGGIGKTRLAIQVAGELAPKFGAGVHFLRVEEGANDAELASAIFSEFSKDRSDRPLQALQAVLHREPRLVIIDNAEVALPAVKSLVKQAARPDGASRWILTSREVLNLPGETCCSIGPMSLPDGAAMGDAVGMLVAGVRRAAPRAAVSMDDLVEICCQSDGIPLCLELIAPHFRSLTGRQIIERFEDLMTREHDEMGPRHRSIQAALETSMQLLSDAERTVFGRLGVFAGSFSLEAAEAVVAFGDVQPGGVLPAIQGLVDASLVSVDLECGRFRMLDQVRRYALRSSEFVESQTELWDRLQQWLEAFVSARCSLLTGPEGVIHTAAIAAETDNMRAFLDHRAEQGEWPLQLLADMVLWWYRENPFQGWKYLSGADGDHEPATNLRMKVLNGGGVIAYAINEWEASRKFLQRAATIAEQLGDLERFHGIRGNMALTLLDGGQPAEAASMLEGVIAYYVSTDNQILETRFSVNLARAMLEAGKVEEARSLLAPTLEKARRLQLGESIALALMNLGEVAMLALAPLEAATYLSEALNNQANLSLANRTFCMVLLSVSLDELGEKDTSQELWEMAQDVRQRFGVPVFAREAHHFGSRIARLNQRSQDKPISRNPIEMTLSRVAESVEALKSR